MILCVTPNPALDRTLTVPAMQRGEVLRPTDVRVVAGGKGLNVARVICALGGQVQCAGFLAGHSGRLVAALAEREGLEGEWTWIEGETRTCTIVLDQQGGEPLTVYEAGPSVGAGDWQRLEAQIRPLASVAESVCISGSLLPGGALGAFGDCITRLRGTARRVWIDTSGAALEAAVAAGGLGIKVNGDEAGSMVGELARQPMDAVAVARRLHARSGAPVIVTLGAAGAVFCGDGGGWIARPPQVEVVSAVGSGDAFLAGFALAEARGRALSEALREGVASGSANALAGGGGRIDGAVWESLLARIAVDVVD
ncbi:MAG: 1-phosphofructokinase family hexose kinase [Herpetosiphon sp.]